jgi:hypothetical protein
VPHASGIVAARCSHLHRLHSLAESGAL